MNPEERTLALWIRGHAEKVLAAVPERLKVLQDQENEDAELTGRQPRLMKIEPLVEIQTPVLAAVLAKLGETPPAEIAEHVKAYRRHCKFMNGVGTTNVLAHQLIAVLDAAGVKDIVAAAPVKRGVEVPGA